MDLKSFLDNKVDQYNRAEFIENDPVVIPHQYVLKQDVEIMGFFAAILAWGQRKTIINKCRELGERMDGAPYQFIMNHQDTDLKSLIGFKHRTFNDTDLLYFVSFFKFHYQAYDTLEDAFLPSRTGILREVFREEFMDEVSGKDYENNAVSPPCYLGELQLRNRVETALNHFRSYFFSLPDFPARTIKHVTSPAQKSTCKRLNMFLRWMVRKDNQGVDFGIWQKIRPAQLICPIDLHVLRVAQRFKLIDRKKADWEAATALTRQLSVFDPADPVKYDFALFGLGVVEKF